MPSTKYEIRKNGDQFCIYDKGGSSPIHGGKGSCHANRTDAVKQLRAIYAGMGKSFSEKCVAVPTKNFSAALEAVKDDELPWIQIFPFGHWSHPVYGEDAAVVNFTTASDFVKNFKENVRRQDIATDFEHGEDLNKGSKASGWYREMELRDDGVYAQIEFTETAKQEIKEGEWKYFSPMFLDLWEDGETGEIHENVIIGGGLTNRPWMKDMVPINFSEAVLEEETTKFRYKDSKWIASDNNGESWRIATTAEVAELEHAEPGSGSPPTPRLDEDDKSGDKDGKGIRRDSPPPQDTKEGSEVTLTADALKLLGLPEDADENAVNEAISSAFKDLPELKEFHEKNKKAKKFSEEYPEEAEEMNRLKLIAIDNEAKRFSEKFERITTKKGEGDEATTEKTTRGFSGLALQEIEKMVKSFSEGKADIKMFSELMETLTSDKAIVDYGETGSSRREEVEDETGDARQRLAAATDALVAKEFSEGRTISWGDAFTKVSAADPKLYSEAMGVEVPKAGE